MFVEMASHYRQLEEALQGAQRPSWRVLAEKLAEEGIARADGKPLAPATLKSTYYRVRLSMLAQGQAVVFGEQPKMRRKAGRKSWWRGEKS